MHRGTETDVLIIGGGPAGLAAAAAAAEAGADVVLVDRNHRLGGILNQCIHDGFGLHAFGEVLTGPEFAARCEKRVREANVETRSDTLVAGLTNDRVATCTTAGARYPVRAGAVILAMGCRERTRGMLRIPGTRPAGVYTAGTAQWLTNLGGLRVGRRAVILGSGDIGLIMARRLVLEGIGVGGVIEILPYASGLPRNLQQCLDDFDIPLYLSHTVTDIHGPNRLERVTVTRVDERRTPIPGTEFDLDCDTLLLSVGLIPENELSRDAGVALDPATGGALVDSEYMTDVPGIFSCGNVLHIHDLADWAAEEGERAGRRAAAFVEMGHASSSRRRRTIPVVAGDGIRYVVPQAVAPSAGEVLLSFRVAEPRAATTVRVFSGDEVLATRTLRRAHPATMIQLAVDVGKGSSDSPIEVRLS